VQYTHNVVLEIAVEAGWLSLAVFLVLVVVAARLAWRTRDTWIGGAGAGLLAFWFVASNFSGDVNSNRSLFLVLGVCLALPQAFSDHQLPRGGGTSDVGVAGHPSDKQPEDCVGDGHEH
jgi:O-antigen ligase